MKTIPFVTDAEHQIARAIEQKVMGLSIEAGILFVGVSVVPSTPATRAVFNIWVGCTRELDESVVPGLVEVALRDEPGHDDESKRDYVLCGICGGLMWSEEDRKKHMHQLHVHAHRGVARSSVPSDKAVLEEFLKTPTLARS